MNPIKSPHELLMEQAGFAPQSPGLVNSGQQMLLDQTGVVPHFAEGGNVLDNLFAPQFADGGQVQMSPEDMLAELIARGQAPEHFAKGGRSVANLLKELKHNPMQSLYNLFNFSDVLENAYKGAQHASQGRPVEAVESGFNAAAGIPAAMPNVPMGVSLAVPLGGQALTEQAAQHMAVHPEFREQMQNVSDSPLGGALSGDAGLAAQIMGNRDYEDVLRKRNASEPTPEPEPEQPRRYSPLYHKTMVTK